MFRIPEEVVGPDEWEVKGTVSDRLVLQYRAQPPIWNAAICVLDRGHEWRNLELVSLKGFEYVAIPSRGNTYANMFALTINNKFTGDSVLTMMINWRCDYLYYHRTFTGSNLVYFANAIVVGRDSEPLSFVLIFQTYNEADRFTDWIMNITRLNYSEGLLQLVSPRLLDNFIRSANFHLRRLWVERVFLERFHLRRETQQDIVPADAPWELVVRQYFELAGTTPTRDE